MAFSSQIFLYVFLPLFLLVYYAVSRRLRSTVILLFSLAFYAWWRIDFTALLIGCIVGTYGVTVAMAHSRSAAMKRWWLVIGVVANLCVLGYFKYVNFAIDTFNNIMAAAGLAPFSSAPILLPIGLSFFVFHAISFIVDVHRGDAKPAQNIVDFGAFMCLFPQLVAGPVLRFRDVADQLLHRDHTFEKFSAGAMRFMIGFCKKVLIADGVAPLADGAFRLTSPTMADAWTGALAYTVQLYFDFSGYSDMALGLALMIGFVFPENFNHPYISASITEFWRRWHISLSTWLREYLYIPLGGNRKGERRTYINLVTTMLLGGLWHGANWTFILWGAWHGMLLGLERRRGITATQSRSYPALRVLLTFTLVVIGWVLFRAANVGEALFMYAGMLGLNGFGFSIENGWRPIPRLMMLVLGLAICFVEPKLARITIEPRAPLRPAMGALSLLIIPLFVWSVATLAAQSFRPFLYYQF